MFPVVLEQKLECITEGGRRRSWQSSVKSVKNTAVSHILFIWVSNVFRKLWRKIFLYYEPWWRMFTDSSSVGQPWLDQSSFSWSYPWWGWCHHCYQRTQVDSPLRQLWCVELAPIPLLSRHSYSDHCPPGMGLMRTDVHCSLIKVKSVNYCSYEYLQDSYFQIIPDFSVWSWRFWLKSWCRDNSEHFSKLERHPALLLISFLVFQFLHRSPASCPPVPLLLTLHH